MNKQKVLRLIRDTAYSVGYGAKLNFATFDIVEKIPGLLAFVQLLVGVYALIVKDLTVPEVGAAMVILGICALYLNNYQAHKPKYEDAGKNLTDKFNQLKALYFEAKSLPDSADFTSMIGRHNTIQTEANTLTISKQVLCSDWYAHYKFFWQQEAGWLEEEQKFTTFRDKIPLSFSAPVVLGVVLWAWRASPTVIEIVKAIKS